MKVISFDDFINGRITEFVIRLDVIFLLLLLLIFIFFTSLPTCERDCKSRVANTIMYLHLIDLISFIETIS